VLLNELCFFIMYSLTTILNLHAMNFSFAKIPIGIHTVLACFAVFCVEMFLLTLFRGTIKTIVPFEAAFLTMGAIPLMNIVYGMIKFIPVKDERTGQTKKWAIGMYLQIYLFLNRA